MEFSGDRPHSAPFVVTEESLNFWACPWEEIELADPVPTRRAALKGPRPHRASTLSRLSGPSIVGRWLMWSLMTLAYIGTVVIIGYGLYDMAGHWGQRLSQTHTGIQL